MIRPRVLRSSLSVAALAFIILLLSGVGGFVARQWARHRQAEVASLPSLPAAFADRLPVRVLWAWEEPEDFHALPAGVGVAYLAKTILLGHRMVVVPRRQPLVPPDGTRLMTVVRIETRPGFIDTPELRAGVAAQLAEEGRLGSLAGLQVDFDARSSQQAFYAGVLRLLKPQLPGGMPLSITALVSWCGPRSWLDGLPIDEAVPMFFRMGGPRALSGHVGHAGLIEPLCRASFGVSTDEPWPQSADAPDSPARVYVFAPAPWRPEQLAAAASAPLSSLAGALSMKERAGDRPKDNLSGKESLR